MALSGHASCFSVLATAVSLSVISCLAIVVRLVARVAIAGQLTSSDILVLGAWMCNLVMGVSMWEQAKHGACQHSSDLTISDLRTTLAWFWAFLWVYYTSLCFTKLSVLLQYLRVFPVRSCVRMCYATITIVVIWGLWSILSAIFTCWPIPQYWNDSGWEAQRCLPRKSLWYTNAAINIATDVVASILPLPIIGTLDISRRPKIILKVVFAAGLVTCVFSILRLAYIYPLAISSDFTWQSPLVLIWSCVEVNSAVLCACAPCFRGLVQRSLPTNLASARASRLWLSQYRSDSRCDSALEPAAGRPSCPGLNSAIGSEGGKSSVYQHLAVEGRDGVQRGRSAQVESLFERQTMGYMNLSTQSQPSSTPWVDDITALPQIRAPSAVANTRSLRVSTLV